jgi:hypothetical protein
MPPKPNRRHHVDTWQIPESQRSKTRQPGESIYGDRGAAVGYLFQIVLAFIAGYGSVLVINAVRMAFQTNAGTDDLVLEMYGAVYINAILSMGAITVIKELLRFKTTVFYQAGFAGVIIGTLTLHNLVHLAPGPFRAIAGEEYVEMTLATTKISTLRWGQYVIEITGESGPAGESKLPQIFSPDSGLSD